MGKLHIVPALCFFVFACFCKAEPQPPSIAQSLSSNEKHQLEREARLVVDLVQNYHESGRLFREIDNREILTRFLKELDPQGRFFNADDVEFIQQRFGRTLKSVYLLKGDLQPAFEIFDLFNQRVLARTNWIEQRLQRRFDFSRDETFTADETDPNTAVHTPAADDLHWELRLKDEILSEIVAGRSEEEAIAEVSKNYAKLRRHIATLDSLAVREHFFDGLLRSFDPHSGYFSADSSKEFAVEMNGTIAGAGLELSKENGLCTVTAVTPGGPADLTTEIRPGDLIDAFGDGDAAWTGTKEKRLREVVASIRGKAGTRLRLAFHHANDAQRHEVTIERAVVVSIADRARGTLCTVPTAGSEKRHIGWIDLPMFYATPDDPTAPSATRDVCELIRKMKKDGLDGLVLDLRNNGGGALPEALALSGLFIPKGLVMLSRGLEGKIIEHQATETPDLYPGPLVILISARSASASEIFTGAMKFHRRAVLVGSPSTFGKGTVQNFIDLAKSPARGTGGAAAWGVARLTSQRFTLPDGTPVQRRGAPSDLVLPDYGDPDGKTEADLPHALPAEMIVPPARVAPTTGGFAAATAGLIEQLRTKLMARAVAQPEFALRRREQELLRQLSRRDPRSLQLDVRRREYSDQLAAREKLRREHRALSAAAAFPVETFEITGVREARAAHEARLRERLPPAGATPGARLHGDTVVVETTGGRLREIPLQDLDFRRFSGDTVALAEAFSTGAGVRVPPEEIAGMFTALNLLEEKTGAALTACAVQAACGGKLDSAGAARGIEALALRLTELEPDLLREHSSLDVPLREALRLAADWAEEAGSTGRPGATPRIAPANSAGIPASRP